MTNPFEEKRKNDRINRLVKENEQLKAELKATKDELWAKSTRLAVLETVAKALEIKVEELTPKKKFYRVGTNSGGGMWYHPDGSYHGAMNSHVFSMLQCHDVPMPYDQGIVGYLSVTDSLESLKKWFNDEDMEVLKPLGYKILTYEATDFKEHNGHWIINQETSIIIDHGTN